MGLIMKNGIPYGGTDITAQDIKENYLGKIPNWTAGDFKELCLAQTMSCETLIHNTVTGMPYDNAWWIARITINSGYIYAEATRFGGTDVYSIAYHYASKVWSAWDNSSVRITNLEKANFVKAIPFDSSVLLTWTPPTGDIFKYRVQQKVSNDATAEWTTIIYPAATVTSTLILKLTNDMQYDFRILYYPIETAENPIAIGSVFNITPIAGIGGSASEIGPAAQIKANNTLNIDTTELAKAIMYPLKDENLLDNEQFIKALSEGVSNSNIKK